MAPKKRSSAKAVEEPAKKAKTDEPKPDEPEKKDEEDVPEPAEPTEKEVDATPVKGGTVKEPLSFRTRDMTLNVVPTMSGRILRTLTDGGMQYLIAGARGNIGMKAGRYFFEVRILESLQSDGGWSMKNSQSVRIGFSTVGSPLLLGEDKERHICFDSDGGFINEGKRTSVGAARFVKGHTVGVVLNLDKKSPNANTISLFRDGLRVSQPTALPESLQGKVLYPHISFRGVSVQVNMGPTPLKALPFACHMPNGAAQADVEVAPSSEPKDGKYDVLFPVCYPDEGSFDWLDAFLEKNPDYVELSDRKILAWAQSSGLYMKQRKYPSCNDKPEFDFGIRGFDNRSSSRVVNAIASCMPRNYVVMEVKGNLLKGDRSKYMTAFSSPCFKKTACVVMGEPSKDFKALQHEQILAAKQSKSDLAWQAKQVEKKRKKAQAELKKKRDEEKKKKEAEQKARSEAAKKAKDEAAAKKKAEEEKKDGDEGEDKKAEEEEEKEEDKKDMEVEEGAKEDDKAEEEKDDEPMEESEEETEPPKVELTDEETEQWFAPKGVHDLKEKDLAHFFSDFCLPEKEEGFDAIKYEWQKEKKAREYLQEKMIARKKVSRVENLQPSKWFMDKYAAFKKSFEGWQKTQAEFKSTSAGKASTKDDDDEIPGGIFAVEDVCKLPSGRPLFKEFDLGDWALLQLRFELWMLQTAFRKDVDDADRPGIAETHFSFYFSKYFKKNLNPKAFGVSNLAELTKLVKDTAVWKDDFLSTPLTIDEEEDCSYFVKCTEEGRRERQRRLDAGDESARLKITQAALNAPMEKPKPEMSSVAAALASVASSPRKGGAKGSAKGGLPMQMGRSSQPLAPTMPSLGSGAMKPKQTSLIPPMGVGAMGALGAVGALGGGKGRLPWDTAPKAPFKMGMQEQKGGCLAKGGLSKGGLKGGMAAAGGWGSGGFGCSAGGFGGCSPGAARGGWGGGKGKR